MQKTTFAVTLLTASTFMFMAFAPMSDNGIAGRTGSPNETNCTNCHSDAAANTGGGSVIITSDIPNWEYSPGTVYHITVTVAQTGVSLFGLGCEALQSTNANGGTLSISDASHTQIKTAGNSRRNIVHTFGGGSGTTNSHSFTFNWTAPATNIGNITFYTAGVAANGNGSSTGDRVYTTSQVATPFVVGTQNKTTAADLSLQLAPTVAQSTTTLHYNLPEAGVATIAICDVKGAILQTILTEKQTEGAHTQTIDVSTLASGLYFVRLCANNQISVQKLIVQ
jgi:hypothetical protein